ncbi:MAG TPA: glycosyltransferase family 2 protein [Deltaproteobacteria bacterium]|nr:glycosyltransferase family 2 protein [Deltaproteobacteria bacterium]
MNGLVSVIVLNWNGKECIRNCLSSVRAQTYTPIELIVVDNGSTDGSSEIVKQEFPEALLIENKANVGFGAGNNAGIKTASGSYVVVLNNDAEMEPDCLGELKKALDRNERYGASAAKILLKKETGLVDAAGLVVCPDGLSIGRGRLEREELFGDEVEVFFASGCCAMFRRVMLDDIAVEGEYYDEDFFAYADDTDLGWRARLRGWKCIYTPSAKAYHLHSAAAGTYSPLKALLVERNRIWVLVKSFPISLLPRAQFYTLARYVFQAYGAIRGDGAAGAFTTQFSKTKLVVTLLHAFWSAFLGMGKMMKKRRIIQKRRVLQRGEMRDILRLYGIGPREIGLKG